MTTAAAADHHDSHPTLLPARSPRATRAAGANRPRPNRTSVAARRPVVCRRPASRTAAAHHPHRRGFTDTRRATATATTRPPSSHPSGQPAFTASTRAPRTSHARQQQEAPISAMWREPAFSVTGGRLQ